jgi:hypothetical protein
LGRNVSKVKFGPGEGRREWDVRSGDTFYMRSLIDAAAKAMQEVKTKAGKVGGRRGCVLIQGMGTGMETIQVGWRFTLRRRRKK